MPRHLLYKCFNLTQQLNSEVLLLDPTPREHQGASMKQCSSYCNQLKNAPCKLGWGRAAHVA